MRFQVTAVNGRGVVSTLELEASNPAEAITLASGQGWAAVAVKEVGSKLSWSIGNSTRFSLLLFSQELLSLLDSGISMVEALETLAEKESRPETRHLIEQILLKLREGNTLSHALECLPRHFPALYVATVRASERTGDLPEALGRYIAYESQLEGLRKKIVSAAIYPLLLIGVGLLVSLFLIGYVVPRFSQVYADLGDNLPWMSQILLTFGLFIQEHGLMAAGLFAVGGFFALRQMRRAEFRGMVMRQLWKLPAVGDRFRIYQLARCYRTAGMLLRGGMSAVPALNMIGGLLAPSLQVRLASAISQIREGQPLSQAMEDNGLTTPVALRMLRVGERSGRMGEMMERIASFYDEDMTRWAEWFTRMFEPLLMALIGLIIGGIVLLLYLPIFELAGSIQ
jgi:general secretion pathway protein F